MRLKDRQLKSLSHLIGEVQAENDEHIDTWGIQSRTPSSWSGLLAEQFGMCVTALNNLDFEDAEVSAIRMATIALKIAEMSQYENAGKMEND